MFVVFDLDGTIADAAHRLPLLERTPVPWDEFYLGCVRDTPIWPVINVLTAMLAGGARVEIWTERSDIVRAETCNWLSLNTRIPPHLLKRMRIHGDHSNDAELKRSWLYDCDGVPDLVFEDRSRVAGMWRQEGIRCCQVDEGNF